MNKVFLIDKPEGITSFDVVFKLRKKLNTKKIGHTGTLDPFATGLLILCVGEATKISSFILSSYKTYIAELSLGKQTNTMDKDGLVVEEMPVRELKNEEIIKVLNSFKGDIEQVPPMFSAIKVNGQRLYKAAREGKVVDVPSRKVNIKDIKLLSYENNVIKFEVTCSKGTYVRTLGEDIAKALGTLGHLISLRRIAINNFSVDQAKSIEDIEESDGIEMKDCLMFKNVILSDKLAEDVKNGKRISLDENDQYVLLLNKDNIELALYEKKDEYYYCVRGFNVCK